MYQPYIGARFERVQSREMAALPWAKKPTLFRRLIAAITGDTLV